MKQRTKGAHRIKYHPPKNGLLCGLDNKHFSEVFKQHIVAFFSGHFLKSPPSSESYLLLKARKIGVGLNVNEQSRPYNSNTYINP